MRETASGGESAEKGLEARQKKKRKERGNVGKNRNQSRDEGGEERLSYKARDIDVRKQRPNQEDEINKMTSYAKVNVRVNAIFCYERNRGGNRCIWDI
ncbi:hypothetical protein SERLA73DRAFT_180637 [Serpula lacrymans var. lacrymans S7.3]|uniref:Uncharacterized protein n=2 Tax=Serpula lacrymans var. lacrymans TaxID=341189 RepID=F8PVQ6_SERL3|nr:uncharacterized protein SERLADRAFT_466327 [Serpula lacrymans var. lacrymans S7.9]EGO00190.1 hypothetical protein SERLA73DRAFT_180637 [Serpula lacrymans var. lacrymans S7.3]EGO25748.1 hypothetical protein SERLADRAFT_466327 [Serpula lacrymans var. lacrymans S7.9]